MPTVKTMIFQDVRYAHGEIIRDGYAIGFTRAGLWKARFNSDSDNYGQDFANHPSPDVEAHEEDNDGLPCSGKINIGPYIVVIYSQDK
jgi:1,4-alpha-glucan branching enzyme